MKIPVGLEEELELEFELLDVTGVVKLFKELEMEPINTPRPHLTYRQMRPEALARRRRPRRKVG